MILGYIFCCKQNILHLHEKCIKNLFLCKLIAFYETFTCMKSIMNELTTGQKVDGSNSDLSMNVFRASDSALKEDLGLFNSHVQNITLAKTINQPRITLIRFFYTRKILGTRIVLYRRGPIGQL